MFKDLPRALAPRFRLLALLLLASASASADGFTVPECVHRMGSQGIAFTTPTLKLNRVLKLGWDPSRQRLVTWTDWGIDAERTLFATPRGQAVTWQDGIIDCRSARSHKACIVDSNEIRKIVAQARDTRHPLREARADQLQLEALVCALNFIDGWQKALPQ